MKSILALLILALLAVSVLAINVDVNVNVGRSAHHPRRVRGMTSDDETLPTVGAGNDDCGPYANSQRFEMTQNNGQKISVTKVAREHLTDPSIFSASPTAKDNSIAVPTACAFNKMFVAARTAGVRLTISSAFRTLERQRYFWNCYQTKRCNNGNLAARPGSSNHGRGVALDLNASSKSSAQYRWLASNGQRFGFIRTVPTEAWHWEHRPGSARASYT
jgi:LAS superfamily LD-carboxypeptidase LdcB